MDKPTRKYGSLTHAEFLREQNLYEQYKDFLYPAVHISIGEKGRCPLGASKVRGIPDLPVDTPWPWSDDNRERHKDEGDGLWEIYLQPTPLDFICQINLAEIPGRDKLPPFPKDGLLSFFWSSNKIGDFEGFCELVTEKDWCVIYTPGGKELQNRSLPTIPDFDFERMNTKNWENSLLEYEAPLTFQPTEIFNNREKRDPEVNNVSLEIRHDYSNLFLGVRNTTYQEHWPRNNVTVSYAKRKGINMVPDVYRHMTEEERKNYVFSNLETEENIYKTFSPENSARAEEVHHQLEAKFQEVFQDWIPLAQFDTSLGVCCQWMVFWIDKNDLAKGDFSNVLMHMSR